MKNSKILNTILVTTLVATLTACGTVEDSNKTTIKEPGKSITVIDKDTKAETPVIAVDRIDRYEKINISDWLDEETVIVSKDNESLGKMSLAELSDAYPKSLYLYNLNTKEYKLLKEQKDTNLSGAVLSADKKHVLYTEYTMGDPAFYVMNLDTLESFGLYGENIAGAMSAKWAENEVIGAAYAGGAYLADTAGKISVLEGLEGEGLVLVDKINDRVYYNTNADQSLMLFNTSTKETLDLNLDNVYDVLPSPDKNQMLVLQSNGSKQILVISDLEGSNQKTIAEGTEIGGISWSPDQRMVAYNLKADVNGTAVKGLYIYDILTGTSTQIVVDTETPETTFSPTSKELSYAEWNGTQWNSSIIYLK